MCSFSINLLSRIFFFTSINKQQKVAEQKHVTKQIPLSAYDSLIHIKFTMW